MLSTSTTGEKKRNYNMFNININDYDRIYWFYRVNCSYF